MKYTTTDPMEISTDSEVVAEKFHRWLNEEPPQVDTGAQPNWHRKTRDYSKDGPNFMRIALIWWEMHVYEGRKCKQCLGDTGPRMNGDEDYRRCDSCQIVFHVEEY